MAPSLLPFLILCWLHCLAAVLFLVGRWQPAALSNPSKKKKKKKRGDAFANRADRSAQIEPKWTGRSQRPSLHLSLWLQGCAGSRGLRVEVGCSPGKARALFPGRGGRGVGLIWSFPLGSSQSCGKQIETEKELRLKGRMESLHYYDLCFAEF